ncbi:MAG: hypothetical protein U1E59_15065 [Amaricoccus sp.]
MPIIPPIVPPIATIVGFVISAYAGYVIKDRLDSAEVQVEIAQMGFVDFGDPSVEHKTPASVLNAYDKIPTAFDDFSESMSISLIARISSESKDIQAMVDQNVAATNKIRAILTQITEANIQEKRSEIAQIAADVPSGLFEKQFKAALRRGDLVRKIVEAQPSDPFFKYKAHPEAWKDTVSAGLGVWDLSEISLDAMTSNRERYDAFTTNVFRRALIYVDPATLSTILDLMDKESENDAALFKIFDDSMTQWLSEIEVERVVATIVISNQGRRPAAIDTGAVMSVSVGNQTITFPAFVATLSNNVVSDPQVLEASSTAQLKLVSEETTDHIKLESGNFLSELGPVSSSQILEGEAGIFIRSSEGGAAVVGQNAFRMGALIRDDQLKEIKERLLR